MKSVRIIGIAILLISFSHVIRAQESDYLGKMENVFDHRAHEPHYGKYIFEADNPLEFLFGFLFLSYKTLLSSQDMDSCVFHPSCSVYGIQSIQKKGIVIGLFNTFDRLTRCHPFAGSEYSFDSKKNKLYDPVD